MSLTLVRLPGFSEHLAKGVHNFTAHTFKFAFSNTDPATQTTPPSSSTAACVLANVTEIAYTNLSARVLTSTTSTGIGSLTFKPQTISVTATGTVPTFRWVYLYNDTTSSVSKPLVGYYDLGSPGIAMLSGDVLTLAFDSTFGALQFVFKQTSLEMAAGSYALTMRSATLAYAGAPSSSTDPYFSSVGLLLHMDGSNGSTSFPDSSTNALTVTPNGSASISTAQSKYGGASGIFNGSSHLSVAASTVTSFPGDFTIECWARFNAFSAYQVLMCKWDQGGGQAWYLSVDSASQFTFAYGNGSGSYGGQFQRSPATALVANTWYHIAASRSGTTVRIFVDGVIVGSSASVSSSLSSSQNVYIGRNSTIAAGYVNGYIDDVRITKGVARYTSTFAPPTPAFPNS